MGEVINFREAKSRIYKQRAKDELLKFVEAGQIEFKEYERVCKQLDENFVLTDELVKVEPMRDVYTNVQKGHQFELSEYALLQLGDDSWWLCLEENFNDEQ